MATDRSALRTALQYATSGQLTLAADQDYYLDLAHNEVFNDFSMFAEGLARAIELTGTTDANGYFTLPSNVKTIESMRFSDTLLVDEISNVASLPFNTGWLVDGVDAATGNPKVRVYRNAAVLANATVSYFPIMRLTLGPLATDISPIPEEFRNAIALKAAADYFRDAGPPFAQHKDAFKMEYEELLIKANKFYRVKGATPQFIDSLDPDAGYNGLVMTLIP